MSRSSPPASSTCSGEVEVSASERPSAGPIPGSLDDEAFERMLAVKSVGNAAFGKEQYSDAIAAYNEALSLFGERVGSGAQREEKVKVLSNRAECHLKLFDWRAAERSASEAICLSPSHTKSLLRRARALAELGGADALARATNDIKTLRASGATRPSELAPIIAQIKAGRAQQQQSALRGAFSSGGAGLGSAAPMKEWMEERMN